MATNILLYRDATVSLPITEMAQSLDKLLESCRVAVGQELVEIPGATVSLASYVGLPLAFKREAERSDIAMIATEKRYDNNFFYHAPDGRVLVISFAGWELLTKLPRSNGFVLMLAEQLVDSIRLGTSHEERSRGCVNDFRARKTDIDFGLRAAFVCEECTAAFESSQPDDHRHRVFEDINRLLNDVSAASRSHADIVEYWTRKFAKEAAGNAVYDVFLCHNSQEKPYVRQLNNRLRAAKIRTWFDEEQLPPGRPWQQELEKQIATVNSAAVVVGPSGLGPWHNMEIRAFLSAFVNRGCPVIPVLLETCVKPPELPLFLKEFTWVDFRERVPEPFQRLLWGIEAGRRI
jgi:hypothetical protein